MKKASRFFSVLLAALTALAAVSVTSFAAKPADAIDSVVLVARVEGSILEEGYGSGFAIGNPGDPVRYIVTNWHVVEGVDNPIVYFSEAGNNFVSATVVGHSVANDLALLKLPEESTERSAISIARSDDVEVLDECYAIGYPGYADNGQFRTQKFNSEDIVATRGVISKRAKLDQFNFDGTDAFLIDATIDGGNSGGPLVNSNGDVIGVNAYSPEGGGTEGGFAITSNVLIGFLNGTEAEFTIVDGSSANAAPSTGEAAPAPAPRKDNTLLIVIIAAAAVVVVAAIVIIAVSVGRGKKNAAPTPAPAPSQAPSRRGVLTGLKGELAGRSFEVGGGVIIGRNPSCQVAFNPNTKGVSGTHCQIRMNGGTAEIVDLGSSYGTTVNGIRLTPNVPMALQDGASVCLGSDEQILQFRMQ